MFTWQRTIVEEIESKSFGHEASFIIAIQAMVLIVGQPFGNHVVYNFENRDRKQRQKRRKKREVTTVQCAEQVGKHSCGNSSTDRTAYTEEAHCDTQCLLQKMSCVVVRYHLLPTSLRMDFKPPFELVAASI